MVPCLTWICKFQWRYLLFSISESKYSVWGSTVFGPKYKRCQFELKLGNSTNSNMHSTVVMFTFPVCDWKYPFWANVVKNIKTLSLSQNLVSRLIPICRIQWWVMFAFTVFDRKYIFGQISSKKSKLSVEAEIWFSRLILIYRIQWCCWRFLF